MGLRTGISFDSRRTADIGALQRSAHCSQRVPQWSAGDLARVVDGGRNGSLPEPDRRSGLSEDGGTRCRIQSERAGHTAAGVAQSLHPIQLRAGAGRGRADTDARRAEQLDAEPLPGARGDSAGDGARKIDLRARRTALHRFGPLRHRVRPRAQFARHYARK